MGVYFRWTLKNTKFLIYTYENIHWLLTHQPLPKKQHKTIGWLTCRTLSPVEFSVFDFNSRLTLTCRTLLLPVYFALNGTLPWTLTWGTVLSNSALGSEFSGVSAVGEWWHVSQCTQTTTRSETRSLGRLRSLSYQAKRWQLLLPLPPPPPPPLPTPPHPVLQSTSPPETTIHVVQKGTRSRKKCDGFQKFCMVIHGSKKREKKERRKTGLELQFQSKTRVILVSLSLSLPRLPVSLSLSLSLSLSVSLCDFITNIEYNHAHVGACTHALTAMLTDKRPFITYAGLQLLGKAQIHKNHIDG